VLYDFGFLPNSDERKWLNSLELSELLDLAKTREIELAGIDIRNKRRVIRAIEAKGEKPTKRAIKKNTLVVGLRVPKDELRHRVEQRTEKMLQNGLKQEVKELAGHFGWDLEPMKGIGYREWRDYFDGDQTLEQTKLRIVSSTMNLAKRQRTWFKRHQNIRWFSSGKAAHNFLTKNL
jgi:tRNA dimethylallyltransferase